MIEVKCELDVVEVNGETVPIGATAPSIGVSSHWNINRFVILAIGGKRYTVVASELKAAIDNACNSAR